MSFPTEKANSENTNRLSVLCAHHTPWLLDKQKQAIENIAPSSMVEKLLAIYIFP